MTALRIELEDGRSTFAPGDQILVSVSWEMERAQDAVELRAIWRTVGKGDEDTGMAEGPVRIEHPRTQDRREVEFVIPEGPYSFSGRLVSLEWALELVALPSGASEIVEITIAPDEAEVLLHGGS